MTDRNVKVILTATDNLTPVLQKAGESAERLAKKVEATEKAAAAFGSKSATALNPFQNAVMRGSEAADKAAASMAGYEKSASAAIKVGGALAFGVGAIVKTFADFDQAMSSVRANSDATAEEFQQLRDLAIDLGGSTVFSAKEAAQGLGELAKAGVSTKDVMGGGLAAALDLAASGQISVAEAAETTAFAMAQFNIQGGQSKKVADLLSAGANAALGGVTDLGQALKQGGLQASNMGLSIDETVATLTAFANAGMMGSDAGTSLKTMLMRLTPQSKEAQKMMDSLGISAFDASGEFVGMEAFAGNLKESLSGLSAESRSAALNVMFGADATRAATIIANEGAEGMARWTGEVTKFDFAAQNAATLTDNLSGDFEELTGSIESAVLRSGSSLNTFLRDTTQFATGVVDAIGSIPAPVLNAVAVAGALTAALSLQHAAFVKLAPVAAGAKGAVQGFGETLRTAWMTGSRAEYQAAVTGFQAAGASAGGAARQAALVAPQMSAAARGMNVLKTAGSGVLGVLGGPWGVALMAAGGALAFFAKKSADAAEKQRELEGVTKQITSHLVANGGAWDQQASQMVITEAANRGLISSLKELGYSEEYIGEALVSQGSAREAILGQIDAQIARLRTEGEYTDLNTGARMNLNQVEIDGLQKKKDGLNEIVGASSAAVSAAEEERKAQEGAAKATGDHGEAAAGAAKQLDTMSDAERAAAAAVGFATEKLATLDPALRGTATALAIAGAAADGSGKKMEEYNSSVTDAGISTKALSDAITKLYAHYSVQGAQDAFSTNINNLGKNLDAKTKSVNGNTDAAIKNRAAVADLSMSYAQMIQKMADEGATVEQLNATTEQSVAQWEKVARAAGIHKDEIARVSAEMRQMPKEVNTNYKIFGDDARMRSYLDWAINFRKQLDNVGMGAAADIILKGVPQVTSGVGQVNGLLAITNAGADILLKAETAAANAKLDATKGKKDAAAKAATTKVDADTSSANSKLDATKDKKDTAAKGATIKMSADTSAADTKLGGLIDRLKGWASRTFNLNIGASVRASANGNIFTYADGGVRRENHVAQIARAGDWRVWAEDETGGEAYIPLAQSKRQRSLAIWRETGRLLGAMDDGVMAFARGGVLKGKALTRGGSAQPGAANRIGLSATVTDLAIAEKARKIAFQINWDEKTLGTLRNDLTSLLTGIDKPKGSEAVEKMRNNWEQIRNIIQGTTQDQEQLNKKLADADRKVADARTAAKNADNKVYEANAKGVGGSAGPGALSTGVYKGALNSSKARPYLDIIFEMAQKYQVQPELVAAVMKQESNFNPNARSGAGARGLLQLMPGTFKSLGVKGSITDPRANIEAGTKYLGQQLTRFNGNVEKALRAYNAGPGAVAKSYGYKETNNYVKKITADAGVKFVTSGSGTVSRSVAAAPTTTTTTKAAAASVAAGSNNLAMEMINNARKVIGNRYVSAGGHGNSNHKVTLEKALVDCSGLLNVSLSKVLGKNVSQVSDEWLRGANAQKMSVEEALKTPGALVGRLGKGNMGHVAISMGDGTILESPNSRSKVRIRKTKASEWNAASWDKRLGDKNAPAGAGSGNGNDALKASVDAKKAADALLTAIKERDAAKLEVEVNKLRASSRDKLLRILDAQAPKMERLALARERTVERLTEATAALAELEKNADALSASVFNAAVSSSGVGAMYKDTEAAGYPTLKEMMRHREEMTNRSKEFNQSIARLKSMGLNDTDLEDIIGMGSSHGNRIAQQIAEGGMAAIVDMNASRYRLDDQAKALGDTAAEAMFGAGKRAGAALIKGLETEQARLEALLEATAKKLEASILGVYGLTTAAPSTPINKTGITVSAPAQKPTTTIVNVQMPDKMNIVDTNGFIKQTATAVVREINRTTVQQAKWSR